MAATTLGACLGTGADGEAGSGVADTGPAAAEFPAAGGAPTACAAGSVDATTASDGARLVAGTVDPGTVDAGTVDPGTVVADAIVVEGVSAGVVVVVVSVDAGAVDGDPGAVVSDGTWAATGDATTTASINMAPPDAIARRATPRLSAGVLELMYGYRST